MKQALYCSPGSAGAALCTLCPHGCRISPGETGLCRARRCADGILYAESYGRVTSLALDPIEKKPLRNFHPGSRVLSVGAYGCNLRCPFCQNHEIALEEAQWRELSPGELAAASLSLAGQGNIGVAFTYNEPLVGYEYVLDAARLVRAQGQRTVLVTNGYIEGAPLLELLPSIDALNIDLKGFGQGAYAPLGGEIGHVLRSIRLAAAHCHVEVTALVVPGLNDTPEQMDELAGWIASVRPDIPLHVTRFFPRHRMADAQPTPVETVQALAKRAARQLRHVYTGNL